MSSKRVRFDREMSKVPRRSLRSESRSWTLTLKEVGGLPRTRKRGISSRRSRLASRLGRRERSVKRFLLSRWIQRGA